MFSLYLFLSVSLFQVFSPDDLYLEGRTSGDMPVDDEDGDDGGSGSGSGDDSKKLSCSSVCRAKLG